MSDEPFFGYSLADGYGSGANGFKVAMQSMLHEMQTREQGFGVMYLPAAAHGRIPVATVTIDFKGVENAGHMAEPTEDDPLKGWDPKPAEKEGWFLELDSDNEPEIAKLAGKAIFDYDEDAVAFVKAHARFGSTYHVEACKRAKIDL